MQIALIGWQGSGKSTLFTALTGDEPSIGKQVNPGVAFVPDQRLDSLHTLYPPAKKIQARIDYLDLAGMAYSDERTGFKRAMINHLQGAQLLAAVIGVFHLSHEADQDLTRKILKDVQDIEDELLISDLGIAENRLEKLEANLSKGLKTNPLEIEVIKDILTSLNNEIPLRQLDFDPAKEKIIRTFAFLTKKPLLVVINVNEEQDITSIREKLEPEIKRKNKNLEIINAQLEAEIALLDQEDRIEFAKEMNIEKPASDLVISAGFNLLGLINFYTVGDDEVRSWSIPKGTNALKGSGEIHTDLERGFIRAEIVPSDELLKFGSLAACRDKGLLRLEGKDYIVQDGEIMHVRFAV